MHTEYIYEIDTEAFGHEKLIASYHIRGKDKTVLIDQIDKNYAYSPIK